MSSAHSLLLQGHDTAEVAYFLAIPPDNGLDFEFLAAKKQTVREGPDRRAGLALKFGDEPLMLKPNGSASGYPFVLAGPHFSLACGPNNSPSFFVKFTSEGLWAQGVEGLHRRFLAWAAGLGLKPLKPETLARVDFAFDFHLPAVDFGADSFVTRASKDTQYRKDGRVQTFQFGRDDIVLRVYDKVAEIAEESGKAWFFPLWGREADVWRVEWQVRKEGLRRFAIKSVQDLLDQEGDLLTYLAGEHDTLRVPSSDGNKSRWPLHPLWRELQAAIAQRNRQGILRELDTPGALRERLMRIAISMEGNLKRVAAIHGVLSRKPEVSHGEALARLRELLAEVHDPLTWKADVAQRFDEVRLGQW